MTSDDDFAATLLGDLCRSFAVRSNGDKFRWVVRTPLLFDDGDTLPVIVEVNEGTWSLTDDGMSVAHLFFDDFEATEARLRRLRAYVKSQGAELDSQFQLRLGLDDPPSAYDIGDFLQIAAAIRGIAVATSVERDQKRYITSVRTRLTPHLADPGWEPNWPVPEKVATKPLYRVDLRIPSDDHEKPVALFVASTGEKTHLAALAVIHLRRTQSGARPLLAYNPERVNSDAVFRFQGEVEDDSAAVPLPPGRIEELLPALKARGVAIAA